MQENAQAVVSEALEAVPAALNLLDEQVHRLGRAIRGAGEVVSEDLGPPTLQGVAERHNLVDLIGEATRDHPVQEWAFSGLTDIHHQGHRPGKDVQNGNHGTEEAPSS